jgi:hypothetical protein
VFVLFQTNLFAHFLATLWRVDENASRLLRENFYQAIKPSPPIGLVQLISFIPFERYFLKITLVRAKLVEEVV